MMLKNTVLHMLNKIVMVLLFFAVALIKDADAGPYVLIDGNPIELIADPQYILDRGRGCFGQVSTGALRSLLANYSSYATVETVGPLTGQISHERSAYLNTVLTNVEEFFLLSESKSDFNFDNKFEDLSASFYESSGLQKDLDELFRALVSDIETCRIRGVIRTSQGDEFLKFSTVDKSVLGSLSRASSPSRDELESGLESHCSFFGLTPIKSEGLNGNGKSLPEKDSSLPRPSLSISFKPAETPDEALSSGLRSPQSAFKIVRSKSK